jgi:hypothetical protein
LSAKSDRLLERAEAERLKRAFRNARRTKLQRSHPESIDKKVNFDFRLSSYFDQAGLRTWVSSTVKGESRRRLAESLIEKGAQHLDSNLVASALPDAERTARGRAHPGLMGGEFLPDLSKDEVEIARVFLDSVTGDVISVRAKRVDQGIAYSITDEYEDESDDDDAPKYRCQPAVSFEPLTMGEIVRMIERAGIVIGTLRNNLKWGSDPFSLVGFVTVTSGFYPELEEYWSERIDRWLRRHGASEE